VNEEALARVGPQRQRGEKSGSKKTLNENNAKIYGSLNVFIMKWDGMKFIVADPWGM